MADQFDGDLDDVRDDDEPVLPAFAAVFADTAADETDPLHVTIAALDDGRNLFGPVLWTPRPGPTYPTVGDSAWVLEVGVDAQREWIVLWWQPS